MTRIAILGDGRMGQLVAALARESGDTVVAHLGPAETMQPLTRERLGDPEVVVEFTVPHAAARLVRECLDAGVPVLSGTTGWDHERIVLEEHAVSGGRTFLWAPNFALGVHLFARVVADAARRFAHPAAGFDAHLVETHHRKKLDAPSGTAKLLAQQAERSSDRAMPITSVRVGQVPGTHEVMFDAAFEQVRLVHEARDRRVFAAGALSVARWLVDKRGVLTLDDFLGEVIA
ncbi:MAG: 4-hydroxy-tetrahydrodipicolinate reductase [Gemmatimonadaceae bacterium]